MPGTITPDVVELTTIPGVELIDVGTWEASTGEHTWTVADLQAAVAAQDDPGYCVPIIKLGHVDPRFDGQPAVGKLVNLRLNAAKTTLIGDYAGVPRWLATAMPSAFPRRSIEGEFGLTTQTGTKHKFALTAVALLGVSEPAISTLEDIKALFTGDGVLTPSATASAGRVTLTRDATGARPAVTTATIVRASVSIDQLRDAFYETQPPGSWAWIRECYVGQDAFIIVDNDNGELFRIPWSEADGSITFGTPEEVVISYVPAPPDPEDDAEPAGLVLLSRTPIPARRGAPVEASMPLTEAQLTEIGLDADADAEAVTTRLLELGAYAAAERDAALEAASGSGGGTATDLPAGVVTIDQTALDALQVAASRGEQAHETLRRQARDALLIGAVKAGKFAESRRTHFEALYDADEKGTTDLIAKLAANTIPVVELGHGGEGALASDDALFAQVYPELAAAGGKA